MALELSGSINISGSMTATTIIVSAPGAPGMVSSSNQLVELNNATGSLIGITNGLMSVTASLNLKTGSYATTGSNTFYGNQTFSGSLFVTGSNVGIGIIPSNYLLHLQLPSGTNGEILRLGRSAGAYAWSLGIDSSASNLNFHDNAGAIVSSISTGGLLTLAGSQNTWVDYTTNTARFWGGSSTNTFALGAGGAIYYQGDSSQFYPTTDNTRSLGTASYRYTAIWATSGTVSTSDEREKKDIVDSDLGLDFVTKLRPVSFKWKVAQNIETTETKIDEAGNETTESIITPRVGTRTHYGLIAQEVEALLDGKDFAGFIHDNEADVKGLRYEQFIPLLIKAVQEQQTIIEELKARVEALENK